MLSIVHVRPPTVTVTLETTEPKFEPVKVTSPPLVVIPVIEVAVGAL